VKLFKIEHVGFCNLHDWAWRSEWKLTLIQKRSYRI
jgi:hypothetical protein